MCLQNNLLVPNIINNYHNEMINIFNVYEDFNPLKTNSTNHGGFCSRTDGGEDLAGTRLRFTWRTAAE